MKRRPQFLGRAVRNRRLALMLVSLRHLFVPCGDGDPVLASPVPRRAATAPKAQGVQGATARPGRWVAGGRADISLGSKPVPKHRSWSRTRKSWSRVARGYEQPPARWVQGEPKSPWSRCNGDYVASAGTGSMPVSASVRLNNPLARRSSKSGRALGIALGGPRGMGNPPARWARYYRAHLVRFEWRRPAILYYGERTLNCGEHYSAAIEQSRNVHYSYQCDSALFLHCTRKFSATGY